MFLDSALYFYNCTNKLKVSSEDKHVDPFKICQVKSDSQWLYYINKRSFGSMSKFVSDAHF